MQPRTNLLALTALTAAACAAQAPTADPVQSAAPETTAEIEAKPAAAESSSSVDDLAREATDPTASLLALNFIAAYTGNFYGVYGGPDDDSTELRFQPVVPFRAFGTNNILRTIVPYHIDGRGEEGVGTVSIFDLVVLQEDWGRWGIGPVMALSSPDTAADEFAIGPAIGGVAQISKTFQAGVFNQNLFAGDTALSQLQPILVYQLGDGWTLSSGDLQFIYDWERSRWASVPLGFQIGRVMPIAGQPMRFSVNPQYQIIDDPGLPEWTVLFTVTLLSPTG
ncbi:MAG: hypothetical protein AAGA20_03940 [Planctomycetota bacterium]